MKNVLTAIAMIAMICGASSCSQKKDVASDWIVDTFDDIKVLRYEVPGFDSLTLGQKELIYYLSQAAVAGRDILWDQNFKYNLPIRFTLEAIYTGYTGDKKSDDFKKFEKYLKKVWFANGIHHHYSNEKFTPEFTEEYFDKLIAGTPVESFKNNDYTMEELLAVVKPAIFDPNLYKFRVNQQDGVDMVQTSANNYYEGVTQKEVEDFYANMIKPNDPEPISYGLNSKLVKENGVVKERVWKIGGMYTKALETVVFWLDKAAQVAETDQQRATLNKLISYYKSGNLREFDEFNILWLSDAGAEIDFVNGFTENYGDPMGLKSSWESLVNFKNNEATKRTQIISGAAQWFEDNSPVDPKYKKEVVKGVAGKVITAAMLGGDSYPATAIGINLPNANWIRAAHGSKSVTIENITSAYSEAAKGDGFTEEFVLNEVDRKRLEEFGGLADNLHTDMHESLGHGSGKLAPGVNGDELKNYGSPLEEMRADLYALYFMGDDKMLELGLIPSKEVAYAEYFKYMMNGMMTQLTRIQPGKNVEQAHMRCRSTIANWCYESGKADNVVEKVVKNGKTYIVVNDFEKLRSLFGTLLTELQRIKSEGDYAAGKALVETYGVKVDPELHKEVLARYAKLNLAPYSGFVNPNYVAVTDANGKITDVKIEYKNDYVGQMLEYSKNFGLLPLKN